MMTNIERLGAELALAIRRQDAARAVLAEATATVDSLCNQISAEPTGTLYGAGSGEYPRIDPARDYAEQHLSVERNAVGWAVTTAPVPMRRDHQDGGSTFRLTPIADAAETATLPAVVPCSGCGEQAVHVHTADGDVQRVADIGS